MKKSGLPCMNIDKLSAKALFLCFPAVLTLLAGCSDSPNKSDFQPEIAQIAPSEERVNMITRENLLNQSGTSRQVYHPTIVIPGSVTAEYLVLPSRQCFLSIEGAQLIIPAASLKMPTKLSVTGLHAADLPSLPGELVNVTRNFGGYRFLPHGTVFDTAAVVALAYDRSVLPEGFTSDDVYTWFFDDKTNRWEALERDSVNESTVYSHTTHFTDMIAGVIAMPEVPEVSGFAPTTFSNMQEANPAAGITQIAPPVASSRGDAELNFPFSLPQGRGEMQPRVDLQYNSGGGSSWTGFGWELAVPSISVDVTWGVPRYLDTLESETYLLNGLQLTPIAHRSEYVSRTPDKHFFPRVENDFSIIIRHGASPDKYWWEVVSKNGVRSFYGGTPEDNVIDLAVSRDAYGNIGFWALTTMRDVHGNFITYSYSKPTSCGQKLYPSEIVYTGHGTTPGCYKVNFELSDSLNNFKRKDVRIDARLGFLQRDSFLLKRVNVTFNNEPVRSYVLNYQEGAFCKTLLKNIAALDAASDTFYKHSFEYYDDIGYERGYEPYGNAVTFQLPDDQLKNGLVNPLYDAISEVSALGLSKSSGFSAGAALTAGAFDGKLQFKDLTIGGNGAYIQSDAEGVMTLTDINADGMLDKVYKKTDGVYYRPNIYDPENGILFGNESKITGLGNISLSKTSGFSSGLEANPPNSFLGVDFSYAETSTNAYFTDFNADGLIDFFDGNTIHFNYRNYQKEPQFIASIDSTPNILHGKSRIDMSGFSNHLEKQQKQEKQFPMHDAVRMWKAPFSGVINVAAPVQLLKFTTDEAIRDTMKDGVRVSIQHSGSVVWADTLRGYDYIPVSETFHVEKDDNVYFRVQSVFNGSYDVVEWDPEIVYQVIDGNQPPPDMEDVNGIKVGHFKASGDFLFSARQANAMPENGRVNILTVFSKLATTDTVRLEISRIDSSGKIVSLVKSQSFAPNDVVSDVSFDEMDFVVKDGDMFRFKMISSTNIDWSKLAWQISVEYSWFDNPSLNSNFANSSIYKFKRVPECITMFNNILKLTNKPYVILDTVFFKKLIFNKPDSVYHTVMAVPQFHLPIKPDSVMFSVKKRNNVLGKKMYRFVDSVFYFPGPIGMEKDSTIVLQDKNHLQFPIKLYDTLFFEYDYFHKDISYFPPVRLAFNDTTAKPAVMKDSVIVNASYYSVHHPGDIIFGHLYRGWGQFDYNPYAETITDRIVEDWLKITVPATTGMPTNTDQLQQDGFNPMGSIFTVMFPDTSAKRYVGIDKDVYLDRNVMSSSRFGLKNVYVKPLILNTSGVTGIPKESVDYSVGGGGGAELAGAGGGAKGTVSYTRGENYITKDMMDMNGDGYPDILEENKIQYTDVMGSLNYQAVHGLGYHQSIANATGFSAGGSFVVAKHSNSMVAPTSNKRYRVKLGDVYKTSNNAQDAEETAKTVFGVSGNLARCNDYCSGTWLDMNGDGLPDKVDNDGKTVRLNLGYSFAPAETWNFQAVRQGFTFDKGLGVGINYRNESIMGGANASWSSYNATKALTDINGDGLPDYVDSTKVYFNTGAGFSQPVEWDNCILNFDNGESFGEAFTGGFTIGIVIVPLVTAFKICINPSGSASNGLCKSTSQFIDLEGDGMPDYVTSSKESEIIMRSSRLGRTNMLKKVRLPLGAEFEVEYGQTASNYNHPGGKWALQSVRYFDGLNGDGVDTLLTTFEYKNGFFNRRERQFFGFDTVRVIDRDLSQEGKILRTLEQVYDNHFYYTKGLLLSQTIFDASGHKQKGVENIYNLKNIATGENVFTPWHETSPFFVALSETRNLSYGGLSQPQIITRVTYDYDTLGNIKQFTDYAAGKESDKVIVNITYHNPGSFYRCSVPALHEVSSSGELLRRSSTEIDSIGNIITINRFTGKSDAVYNLVFDKFGNVTSLTRPANYNGDRMQFAYTYDTITHSFVIRTEDSYKQFSLTDYDLKWQKPKLITDINGEKTLNTYDARGRIKTIAGPYELAAGRDFSVKFEYYPDTVVPYARTLHFDSTSNFIETYMFTDGTGRQVQTKKTALLYNGEGQDDIPGMVVSGKVFYDALGHAHKVFQPLFEPANVKSSFNTGVHNVAPSLIFYDVLGRPVRVVLPDQSVTAYSYGIGSYKGDKVFADTITDANGNISVKCTAADGNLVITSAKTINGDLTTAYDYNVIDELLAVTDPIGNRIVFQYDLLGRKISENSPESGLTEFVYDNAGNILKKITSNIRQQMPDTGAIVYKYDFERLTEIVYPKNIQNRVNYTYGKPEDKFGRIGRIKLVEDASGGQEFFYGKQGEIVKTIRTVQLSESDMRTWIWSAEYDTWNRIRTMNYPDGEKLIYQYNRAGNLARMSGSKLGRVYNYITGTGYDEQERPVFIKYGNNTSTQFQYEPDRQRLSNIVALANSSSFMANEYKYDALNNILKITGTPDSTGNLGGSVSHLCTYDELNRVTQASGIYQGKTDTCKYALTMKYDQVGNILGKTQSLTKNGKAQANGSYVNSYSYNLNRPNIVQTAGVQMFGHDANGNIVSREDTVSRDFRHLGWDEENRLTFISDNGYISRYVYDAAGDRVIKSHGGSQGVYINGAPAGIINHADNNYTVYVSPYFVLKNDKFTKHYYAGSSRLISKVGNGQFNNQYRPSVFEITAGSVNYINRQQQIANKRNEYYRQQQIPPGPPTLKGINGEPEFTGYPIPDAGNVVNEPPAGWPRKPYFAPAGGPPGAPVQWGDSITNDNIEAGFGYNGTGTIEEELRYFYHKDHVGSTNYITDAKGNVKQFIAYTPFGEVFFEKHNNWATDYRFNARELDTETGLYIYGNRFYDPDLSRWLNPHFSPYKNPEVSPFAYCTNNPVAYTVNIAGEVEPSVNLIQLQLKFLDFNKFTAAKLTMFDPENLLTSGNAQFSENFGVVTNGDYFIGGNEDNAGSADIAGSESEDKPKKGNGQSATVSRQKTGSDNVKIESGSTKPTEMELKHDLSSTQKVQRKDKIKPMKIRAKKPVASKYSFKKEKE